MSSEEKVLELMGFLDDGVKAVEEIEKKLQEYESVIGVGSKDTFGIVCQCAFVRLQRTPFASCHVN